MRTKELTEENPLKLILFFMFPLFVGKFFQQIYHFTDALIVSRIVGIKALAAIGASSSLIFFVINFIFDSIQGFTLITAQRFGAKDYENVKKSVAASIIISFCLTVIFTLLLAPSTKILLTLMRTPADIIGDAVNYSFIIFLGIFASIFYNLASNIIRALGNSKTPLYFLIFSVIINIFFDLLFVAKFNRGIEGAAWATVLSQIIVTVLCGFYLYKKFPLLRLRKKDFDIEWSFYLEHLRIGFPMGINMAILSFGFIVVQFVLNSFGAIAVASYTIAMKIDQLFSQALLSLGSTMSIFTAQNFGAKKMSRIKEGVEYAISIAGFISLFLIIILKLFGQNIISIFMEEINPEIMSMTQIYLNIIVIFFIFLGILLILRNTLQGMGQVKIPFLSVSVELIIKIICAFALSYYLGFYGICLAVPIAWVFSTIIIIGYMKLKMIKAKYI